MFNVDYDFDYDKYFLDSTDLEDSPIIDADFQFDPLLATNDGSGRWESDIYSGGKEFTLNTMLATEKRLGGAYVKAKSDDETVQVKIGNDGYFYVKKYPSTPEEVGALGVNGTAVKTQADENGNSLVDVYLTKTKLESSKQEFESTFAKDVDLDAYDADVIKTYVTKSEMSDYESLVAGTYATQTELSDFKANASKVYETQDELVAWKKDVSDTYITKENLSDAQIEESSTYITPKDITDLEKSVNDTYITKIDLSNVIDGMSKTYIVPGDITKLSDDASKTYITKQDVMTRESEASNTYSTKDEVTQMTSDFDKTYATKDSVSDEMKGYAVVNDKAGNRVAVVKLGDKMSIKGDGTLYADDQTLELAPVIDERLSEEIKPTFSIGGSVDNAAALPSSADNGTIYLLKDVPRYKVYINGNWEKYDNGSDFSVKDKVLKIN